jgi:hypothetical protein
MRRTLLGSAPFCLARCMISSFGRVQPSLEYYPAVVRKGRSAIVDATLTALPGHGYPCNVPRLRVSEIPGLRWEDIDLEGGLLQIRRSVVNGL